jgi:phosphatidate cytidylyltransferase
LALSSLAQRVLTALVLVPLVLAAVFLLPPRAFAVVALAIVAAAAVEWARLAAPGAVPRLALVGATVAIGATLLARVPDQSNGWPSAVVVAICGLATAFWTFVAPAALARHWNLRLPWTAGVVAVVVLVAFWIAIVELQARSPGVLLAAMAVVWIADTAAYFTGRAFGRRKLAPSISPGKTWEGVFGALAAVALYGIALVPLARAAGYREAPTPAAVSVFIVLLLAFAAVSVVGDLFESMLKRQAGVKDSGSLLPGHGGLLDRVDALLAAMPPAALAATAFLRPAGAA